VLVGKVAGVAGYHAPVSFIVAAVIAGLSALSFAEMASRMPVSAGESAYVQEGLGIRWVAQGVGFLVIAAGIVSAAAILRGSAGYLGTVLPLPAWILPALVLCVIAALAAWGITESVAVAGILTVLETGALAALVWAGRNSFAALPERWHELTPAADPAVVGAILAGGILAFYAFIGFEDMVNVAEEVRAPTRALPLAVIWTLAVTLLLYVLVALVCVLTVAPQVLADSPAPVALVWTRLTGLHAAPISLIATVGVLNGALIQTIMATRVIYGMAARGWLPASLATVNPRTRTPLRATLLVAAVILLLAYGFPIVHLAEATSFFTLIIFALVNGALWRLKMRAEGTAPPGVFVLPFWLPVAGTLVSGGFALFQAWQYAAG
jgi:APA family basic amino acid/polyamine antiporter